MNQTFGISCPSLGWNMWRIPGWGPGNVSRTAELFRRMFSHARPNCLQMMNTQGWWSEAMTSETSLLTQSDDSTVCWDKNIQDIQENSSFQTFNSRTSSHTLRVLGAVIHR